MHLERTRRGSGTTASCTWLNQHRCSRGPTALQSERVRIFASSLLDLWDRMYEPADIRRRAAATLFTLATGPFRVQSADWPGETTDRISMAHRWLESAHRVR